MSVETPPANEDKNPSPTPIKVKVKFIYVYVCVQDMIMMIQTTVQLIAFKRKVTNFNKVQGADDKPIFFFLL